MTVPKLETTNCPYCTNHVSCSSENYWKKWGIKYNQSSDIIYRSDGFIVTAGLGGILPGYTIMMPERHLPCIGALDKASLQRFVLLKAKVRDYVQTAFGNLVFFEHGMSSCRPAGGCIDHAHMHAVPTPKSFRTFLNLNLRETVISDLHEVSDQFKMGKPYLFYEDIDGTQYIYAVEENLPSQYFRRIWANIVGRPNEWDWMVFLFEENVSKTIDILGKKFREVTE